MTHKTTGAIVEITLPYGERLSGKLGLGGRYGFLVNGSEVTLEIKSIVSSAVSLGLRHGPIHELRDDSRTYVLPGNPFAEKIEMTSREGARRVVLGNIDVVNHAAEPQVRKYPEPSTKTAIGMHYISTNGVEWLVSFDEKELKTVVYVRTRPDELFVILPDAAEKVAHQVATSGTNCLGPKVAEVFL
ncbi:hypothetical protein vBSlqSZDD2_40 [Serratia phage vB_SlqS_ZDD2]|nr:hypothetical protein vBSlqSZDD2_40 [Serratia phage vB_SlqS_ZDD2]